MFIFQDFRMKVEVCKTGIIELAGWWHTLKILSNVSGSLFINEILSTWLLGHLFFFGPMVLNIRSYAFYSFGHPILVLCTCLTFNSLVIQCLHKILVKKNSQAFFNARGSNRLGIEISQVICIPKFEWSLKVLSNTALFVVSKPGWSKLWQRWCFLSPNKDIVAVNDWVSERI